MARLLWANGVLIHDPDNLSAPLAGADDLKSRSHFLCEGTRQEAGVTANVVWYAVKRCAGQAGIAKLGTPRSSSLAPASAMVAAANSNKFSFCLATLLCKQRSGTSEANRSFKMR